MGLSVVLDTNVVIYWLKDLLAEDLPAERLAVSLITEMELLSFPAADPSEIAGIQACLARLEIVPVSEAVKSHAVTIRREHRLKLPDAIVAGTARALDAELLSNDDRFSRVPGLRCRPMRLKRTS